jgi:hemoglobin/transferrin/lactoferrin receptor protein
VRFAYDLEPDRRTLFGGISQGFRAPNLSDVSRFDSARSNEFEIPALGLDEEDFLAFELGVRHEGERLGLQAAAFYTQIEDGIVRVPTGNVNGDGDAEITKANVGDGYAAGIEFGATYEVTDTWSVFGNFTWLDGEQDTFPTAAPIAVSEPLDRLMPMHLFAGARFEPTDEQYWMEFSIRHMDDADDLSTRDMNDITRIPPGGTPNFTTLDLRGGYAFSNDLKATLALENLTDEDYRIHGSGQNAPGRNLIISLRWSF